MNKLYSPRNESELALIKSILDGENLHYFVRNDHFGSMRVGPRIELFNIKTIFVSEDHYDQARELIYDFIDKTEELNPALKSYSFFDKIRMIFEVFVCHWIMPGSRRNIKKTYDKK